MTPKQASIHQDFRSAWAECRRAANTLNQCWGAYQREIGEPVFINEGDGSETAAPFGVSASFDEIASAWGGTSIKEPETETPDPLFDLVVRAAKTALVLNTNEPQMLADLHRYTGGMPVDVEGGGAGCAVAFVKPNGNDATVYGVNEECVVRYPSMNAFYEGNTGDRNYFLPTIKRAE